MKANSGNRSYKLVLRCREGELISSMNAELKKIAGLFVSRFSAINRFKVHEKADKGLGLMNDQHFRLNFKYQSDKMSPVKDK